jgi:dienelactone hydrolase
MKIKYFFSFISFLIVYNNFSNGNELPTITVPLVIKEWQYAGPFETGAREGAVDPLYPWGAVQPDFGYPSAFAEGGNVIWRTVKSDDKGNSEIVFSNAPWTVLGESWGVVGINYTAVCKGYIQADKRYKAKINSRGVRGVTLNGMNIMTDYYGLKRWEPPVILESGRNEVILKLNSYSDTVQFGFSFLPDSDNVRIVNNDVTYPDAVENTIVDSWVGVPIVNCTDEWLKDIILDIGGDEYLKLNSVENISIPPLGVIKIPVKLQSVKPFPSVTNDRGKNYIQLNIKVTENEKHYVKEGSIKIPLRKHGDDRRETFLSKMDNSVQFYGIKEPILYEPSKHYGMIFSLHGAGVDALGQVGAYAPRDWAFVVAPTNRREYGFNWQEQGRIDALEVLEVIRSRYPIDDNRIMLTGHSMGGHGVWHFGTFYADKFAAMAPACGWMSIDMYIPMFLTKYNTYAPPGLKSIWELGYLPDRPQFSLNNLYNLPVMIMISGADDNVPPVHGRLFAASMRRLGMNPEVHDIPGKPHWFDDDTIRPGADVTDAVFFEKFYKYKVRNQYPDEVKFVMTDAAVTSKLYWVKIIDTYKYPEPASVDAKWIDNNYLDVTSGNVSMMEIKLKDESTSQVNVNWNGNTMNISPTDGVLQIKDPDFVPAISNLTKAIAPGPMKRAYMDPFVIIIGSNTDEQTFNSYLNAARQQSIFWWYNANGYVEIMTDKDASPEKIKDKNLILIGTQEDNLLLKDKILLTPVQISGTGIYIDGNELVKGEYAVKFIYPDTSNNNRLILFSTGTSSKYALLAEAFPAYATSGGLPDFIIFNEKVREYGFGGLTAAGYFDKVWKFDRSLSYY